MTTLRIVTNTLAALCMTAAAYDTPDSAYVFTNDICVVDAGSLQHNTAWALERAINGWTGEGYLRYAGPERRSCYTQILEPHGYVDVGGDTDGSCQGPEEDRVYITVKIENPGAYSVNAYCYHTYINPDAQKDPNWDASVWVHMTHLPPPIDQQHPHPETANRWGWMTYGPDYYDSPMGIFNNAFGIRDPGIYTFYFAGKDPNFRMDRIHIYRKLGQNLFPVNYLDTSLPFSVKEEIATSAITRNFRRARTATHADYAVCGSGLVVVDLNGRHVATDKASPGMRMVFDAGNPLGFTLQKLTW